MTFGLSEGKRMGSDGECGNMEYCSASVDLPLAGMWLQGCQIDLALYSSLSCCRLSSVSGNPWLLFIRENKGQRSMLECSVFMDGHWKALIMVRMKAGGGGWPSCHGFLKCQDAGDFFTLGHQQQRLLLLFS